MLYIIEVLAQRKLPFLQDFLLERFSLKTITVAAPVTSFKIKLKKIVMSQKERFYNMHYLIFSL